jgi:hypothetical protein
LCRCDSSEYSNNWIQELIHKCRKGIFKTKGQTANRKTIGDKGIDKADSAFKETIEKFKGKKQGG